MTSLAISPAKFVPTSHGVNLMPFHIAHSGSAPVSTYFRIKPAQPNPGAPPPQVDAASELSAGDSQKTLVEADEIAAAPAPAIDPIPELSSPIHRLLTSTKRFVSAFRGRMVHGLEVPMPKGYTGLILRSEEHVRAVDEEDGRKPRRTKAPPKTNGRRTRGTRSRPVDVDEDLEEDNVTFNDAMDVDGGTGRADEDEEPVRMLKPSAQFSSFVLWHPDIPVDEGKDEYLRSMSEWIELAAEIHRVEEG